MAGSIWSYPSYSTLTQTAIIVWRLMIAGKRFYSYETDEQYRYAYAAETCVAEITEIMN